MHMTLKRRLVGVAAAAALLTGAGASTAMAGPTAWQTGYYENWFSSSGTCHSRGNWIIGAPPYAHPGVQGINDFRCYKASGDSKYSMDVRWYGRWATKRT